MLFIVLVLVLAALGLLVAALITANSLWAWISIGLSVVAGLLLLFDWLRRRKKRAAPAEEEAAEDASDEDEPADGEEKKPEDVEQTVLMPAAGELGDAEDTPEPQQTGDPGEEKSDPADVAVVSELEIEVVVVDEYPRYHVTSCEWLEARDTIPLGIGEARQLGFTPCALCTPDAEIAGKHREKA
ncbi:hypothetical protein [Amycolatopsis keratiniphila]|uniref:Uncharacterized protein n=1 Tax=Amycolatopsis keratiniphila subsp. keratiniphila TaxID=227715 RepID=A0A1W2M2J2_9PSEU|nr:hypothetical protein [Amycolatopsis keratiniphila]OLZ60923.1 hypothetical protein BS330_02560 [Amycolatopsis keratiniphila subsp. nogabecina]ONF74251.1 hypothetical protein AVR91_0202815 [Amycolatopsis keratiniphila subsp. keratiniphila]SDT99125.1 hypothetical protein SAMN04489733_0171 [Amycolatopsis keratiniphila]